MDEVISTEIIKNEVDALKTSLANSISSALKTDLLHKIEGITTSMGKCFNDILILFPMTFRPRKLIDATNLAPKRNIQAHSVLTAPPQPMEFVVTYSNASYTSETISNMFLDPKPIGTTN